MQLDGKKHFNQFSKVCMQCKHWNENAWLKNDKWICAAFPKEIPFAIWSGKNNHRNLYKGDNGIRFEPIKKKA